MNYDPCACCTSYEKKVPFRSCRSGDRSYLHGMQGKKDYQEKFFNSFRLSYRVPWNNFYRRLKGAPDLDFPYPLTKGYYGESGQKSIDPVVFFKLALWDIWRTSSVTASYWRTVRCVWTFSIFWATI